MPTFELRQPAEEVFRTTEAGACTERALVLRAMDIPCDVRFEAPDHVLYVAAENAPRALAELSAYARENVGYEAKEPDASAPASDGWSGVLGYVIIVLLVAICANRDALGFDWGDRGMTSAKLIREGQWWRTFTALTLHANAPHLIANVAIGGLFGLFAARLLGGGLAWLCILLGGAAGNAINAWIRPITHASVGASTAIFAALGLISAWAWTKRHTHRLRKVARWTPVIGGVALLGYLGGGGGNVDVTAHIAGFAAGLAIGIFCGVFNLQHRLAGAGQVCCAVASIVLLALTWYLAFAGLTASSPA